MRRLSTLFIVCFACALAGCAASEAGLSRSVRRHRANLQTETYHVLHAGLGAVGDGYTFLNARFRFEFDKGFDQIDGFSAPEKRYERGAEASEFLMGGYDFVHDIFGIEANKTIRVVIAPTIRDNPMDAYTQTQWRVSGTGGVIEDSFESTMHFGADAFQNHSYLAHEMTHALLNRFRLPAWFAEGIAVLVEMDYAQSERADYTEATTEPIALDENGFNAIQTWRGHGSELPDRTIETYGSAYAIVKEIRARYGRDVYTRFFRDLNETKYHLQDDELTLKRIIETLNRVTGQDATRFFREIRFDTG